MRRRRKHSFIIKRKITLIRIIRCFNTAQSLIAHLNDIGICTDTDNCVNLRHFLADGFRITLRKAARRHQQSAAAGLLVARHFKQRGNGLFLRGLNKSASVDNDDFRPRRIGNDLIAMLLEHREHLLGIHAVFAASQRDQPNCCCQNDCSFNCRTGKFC